MNVVDNEVKPVVDETCISLEGKTAPDGEDVLRKVEGRPVSEKICRDSGKTDSSSCRVFLLRIT